MALNDAFRSAYDLAFQVSPIILTGGNYSFPMPIIGLTGQIAAFLQGVASSQDIESSFYARYLPIPGSTVINNALATYPFANQQVAANAVIRQPTNISLMMIAPVKEQGGYLTKLPIFTSLQQALEKHNANGGTYTVVTPAFIYSDCVMSSMTDITSGETKQRQVEWQLDFVKPLITVSDANAAFSAQMEKIAGGGVLTQSSPTGIAGANPMTGIAGTVESKTGGAIV